MKKKKPFNLADFKKQLSSPSRKKAKKKVAKKKVVYEDHIVAFIDLLGFSKKIEKLNKKDSIKEIENLEWIMDKVVNPSRPSKIKANYFSDCICLSEELPKKDSENYLDTVFYFLLDLIHIQGELIFQGVLVRGGVSIDRHYSSDRLIFSKGLLKSYFIESKKAFNPVIMLDDSVYEKIIKFHEKNPGGYFNKNHYLSKVNSLLSLSIELPEGDHVLNYLSFWREVDDPSYIIPYFKKHKGIIETSAKEFKNNKAVLLKYKWMASYHNYYLLKAYKLDKSAQKDLLIDTKSIFGDFSLPKVG
ncbi:MAG: hypothetical protein ACPGJV_15610 [Bacteriovoracaceae bacterium]